MKKLAILSIAFMMLGALSATATPGDVLLGIPAVLKTGAGINFVVQAVTSIMIGHGILLVVDLPVAAAFGVPSGLLLWNEVTSNAQGVRFWRQVSFFTDAGLTLAAFGVGIWALAGPADPVPFASDWRKIAGAVLIGFSIPMGLAALLDLVPFPMESASASP